MAPIDLGISTLPSWLFIVIHATAFLVAVFFANRTFAAGRTLFAWGFTLYAIAEVSYALYHVNTTTFLFSHTISEVLDLVAFGLVFAGLGQLATQPRRTGATAQA